MELKHKLWRLEKDLKRHEHDIKKLRVDVKRQCDHYNELWRAHNDLLMEAHVICLKITKDKALDANLTNAEVAFQSQMNASC